MRRAALLIMVIFVGVTLLACRGDTPVQAPNPVNIVLIIVDTLRPDYLSCYGAPEGTSPAIDALAADNPTIGWRQLIVSILFTVLFIVAW